MPQTRPAPQRRPPSRRRHLQAAIAALSAGAGWMASPSLWATPAALRLLVPYPAGGVSDALARALQAPWAAQLGRPVVVDNAGGASGAIAVRRLLATPAAAPGLQVLQGSPADTIVAPAYQAAPSFASQDLRLVQLLGHSHLAIYARAGLPATDVDSWLAHAASRAQAGAPLSYASVGPGSLYHLLGAHISQRSGAAMTHVPYRGGAPALHDLLGERVDVLISVWGQHYQRLVAQGRIRLLALLTRTRLPHLAAYPCTGESAALRDLDFSAWTGYLVPRNTPEPAVATLHRSLQAALAHPALQRALQAQAMQAAPAASLAECAQFYAQETLRYRALVVALAG